MTQWDPPVGMAYGMSAGGGGGALMMTHAAAGQPGGLPSHIEARTANDGRIYYLNHRTQATSWTPPAPADW